MHRVCSAINLQTAMHVPRFYVRPDPPSRFHLLPAAAGRAGIKVISKSRWSGVWSKEPKTAPDAGEIRDLTLRRKIPQNNNLHQEHQETTKYGLKPRFQKVAPRRSDANHKMHERYGPPGPRNTGNVCHIVERPSTKSAKPLRRLSFGLWTSVL